jgi:hypothetical protein
VSLQMDALRDCRSENSLRRTLDTLPKTLDETYSRILDQIDDFHKPAVHRLLQCICISYCPLTVEDLGHIYRIGDPLKPLFREEDALFRPTDVVDLCHGLLCIVLAQGCQWMFGGSDEVQIVQLVHFSVKEYLFSPRAMFWRVEAQAAHLNIIPLMIVCYLDFIMSLAVDLTRCSPRDMLLKEHPFAMYTMQYLSWHLSAINPREHTDIIPSFRRLLDPASPTLNRRIGMAWLCFGTMGAVNTIPPLKVSTLIIAIQLGLPRTCEWLLSLNPFFQIESLTKVYHGPHTPFLVHAAEEERADVIKVLLRAGANVDQQDEWGVTALYAASRNGHIDTVRTLIHAKARTDLITSCSHYRTPFHIAASRGRSSIVQMLIEAGADVNGGPSCKYTPLQIAAAENGDEETILGLLAGANANADSGGLEAVGKETETSSIEHELQEAEDEIRRMEEAVRRAEEEVQAAKTAEKIRRKKQELKEREENIRWREAAVQSLRQAEAEMEWKERELDEREEVLQREESELQWEAEAKGQTLPFTLETLTDSEADLPQSMLSGMQDFTISSGLGIPQAWQAETKHIEDWTVLKSVYPETLASSDYRYTAPVESLSSAQTVTASNRHLATCTFYCHKIQWEHLPTEKSLKWDMFPWPLLMQPTRVEEITPDGVEEYLRLLYELPQNMFGSVEEHVMDHIDRWDYNRMDTKVFRRVDIKQQKKVEEGVIQIGAILQAVLRTVQESE